MTNPIRNLIGKLSQKVADTKFLWNAWRFIVSIAAKVSKRAQEELDLIEWCDGYEWAAEYKDLDTINSYLAVCKDMGWYGEYEKGAAEWAARRYNEIRKELARL